MSQNPEDLVGVGAPAQLANAIATYTVASAVTAAGTNLATATQLKQGVSIVTTAAASTGVKLPSCPIGTTCIVQNLGASDLELFPATSSEIINGAAAGGAITLAAATDVIAFAVKTTSLRWVLFVAAGPAT